jgi:hypothetical protein
MITVQLFGAPREFVLDYESDHRDVYDLTIDGVECNLEHEQRELDAHVWRPQWRAWANEKPSDWFDSAQEAAADLEAKLMPLGKLLAFRWQDHIHHLQRLADSAGMLVGVFGNEIDEAEHVKAVRDLEAVWSAFESWRWQQPAPELLPEQSGPRVEARLTEWLPDRVNVDGMTSSDSEGFITYLGDAVRQPDGTYQCLADVSGALCRVEVKLTAKPSDNRSTFLRYLEEQERVERDTDVSELEPMGGEF